MKPQIAQHEVEAIVAQRAKLFENGIVPALFVLGIRGYYLDSLGKPGANDRGIYDDALIIRGPTCYATFRANVDPSVARDKVAVLEPEQVVYYRHGMHRAGTPGAHMAWRQDSPVIVRRDVYVKPQGFVDDNWGISLGGGLWTDRGWDEKFWINIHKGGVNGTSSLGCQTIQRSDWPAYYSLLRREQTEHNIPRVAYLLIQDPRMS